MSERALAMDCFVGVEFRPECGCPQEHWHVHGCCFDIHFEEDGTAHAVAIGEDWETETDIDATSMDEARSKAFDWLSTVMTGDPQ